MRNNAVKLALVLGVALLGSNPLCAEPAVSASPEELSLNPLEMRAEFPKLAEMLAQYEAEYGQGKLGAACHQLGDRFMLAGRLVSSLKKSLASEEPAVLFFADRQIRDLKLFLQFFEAKKAAAAARRDAPEPLVFSLKEFGAKGDGVTDDGPAFIAAFRRIAEEGGKPVRLTIPAGKYLLSEQYPLVMTRRPFGEKHNIETPYQWNGLIVMHNLKNVTVSGEKDQTVLIQKSWEGNGVMVVDCENVRWENVTLRRNTPPFLQGTVLETYPAEKAIRFRSDPGFVQPGDPRTAGLTSVCQTYDEEGNILRGASQVFYEHKYEKNDDGTYKLFLKSCPPALKAGQKIIFPVRKGSNGSTFWTARSRFCVYDNITVYDSRGAVFTDVLSFGSEYLNCRIVPDKAIGAWFSANADGIHCQNDDFGVFVANCEFRRLGDDAFNTYVKGKMIDFAVSDGVVAELGYPEGTFFSVLSSHTGEVKAGRLSLGVDMEEKDGKKYSKTLIARPLPEEVVTYATLRENRLSQKELNSIQTGFGRKPLPDIVFAHGKSGVGTVIRDSVFEGMRNNQLVIQTSSALVENNTAENCTVHGIYLGSLVYPWLEGFHPFNVVIRNNRIRRAPMGIGMAMNGFDQQKSHSLAAFADIVIENNTVESREPFRITNPQQPLQ